jgi:hypothetical protein
MSCAFLFSLIRSKSSLEKKKKKSGVTKLTENPAVLVALPNNINFFFLKI